MAVQYSIIIPVYNGEKYLSQCLDSILTQDTSSEYEIILVDDGSPDRSGSICDNYAENHENIQVIHQKNQGVCIARNNGLLAAKGEYILFVDADDYLALSLLSHFDPILTSKPDMIVYSEEIFDENGHLRTDIPIFPNGEGESGPDYLRRHFDMNILPFYGGYNYLLRRNFLLEYNLFFPVGVKVNEDLDFILRCLSAARLVSGLDYIGYYYRIHRESVVHTPTPEKQLMYLQMSQKWFEIYPTAALADLHVMSGVSVSQVGTRSETKELTAFMRAHCNIWGYTSDWRAKLAVHLFRIFGCYNGSAIFLWLVNFRRVLCGLKRES